jgi:hypothetical protein
MLVGKLHMFTQVPTVGGGGTSEPLNPHEEMHILKACEHQRKAEDKGNRSDLAHWTQRRRKQCLHALS